MTTQAQIAHMDGYYRVYLTETGIDRRFVGPRIATPREAGRYADLVAATELTSPLRGSAEPIPAPSRSPIEDGGLVVGSADSRKGVNRHTAGE